MTGPTTPARTPPALVPGRWGALGEPPFRRLFTGQLVSALGSAVAPVALAFAVLDLTGSVTDLGYVLAARTVPLLVFLLVGGVAADRWPRQRVMVGANVISAGTQAAVAVLLLTGAARVWQLATLAAVNGLAVAFFSPASQSVVPQTVSPARLAQANSLLRLTRSGSNVVGAALGGITVAAAGPGWAIAVDAASYAAAAAILTGLVLPARPARTASRLTADLAEGWTEFWSRTWLWAIVAQFSLVNAADAAGFNLLGPVVARRDLGGARAWGLVLSAEAAGLVLGGLLSLRWQPSRPLLAGTIAVFPLALPIVVLAVHPTTAALAATALLAGIGLEQFGVAWSVVMQEQIPADRLSRVYSYDILGSVAAVPVGFALAGPLTAALGVTPTLWGCALLVVIPTGLVLLSRDVRTLTRRQSPAANHKSPAGVAADN